jgi:hypothetical protein
MLTQDEQQQQLLLVPTPDGRSDGAMAPFGPSSGRVGLPRRPSASWRSNIAAECSSSSTTPWDALFPQASRRTLVRLLLPGAILAAAAGRWLVSGWRPMRLLMGPAYAASYAAHPLVTAMLASRAGLDRPRPGEAPALLMAAACAVPGLLSTGGALLRSWESALALVALALAHSGSLVLLEMALGAMEGEAAEDERRALLRQQQQQQKAQQLGGGRRPRWLQGGPWGAAAATSGGGSSGGGSKGKRRGAASGRSLRGRLMAASASVGSLLGGGAGGGGGAAPATADPNAASDEEEEAVAVGGAVAAAVPGGGVPRHRRRPSGSSASVSMMAAAMLTAEQQQQQQQQLPSLLPPADAAALIAGGSIGPGSLCGGASADVEMTAVTANGAGMLRSRPGSMLVLADAAALPPPPLPPRPGNGGSKGGGQRAAGSGRAGAAFHHARTSSAGGGSDAGGGGSGGSHARGGGSGGGGGEEDDYLSPAPDGAAGWWASAADPAKAAAPLPAVLTAAPPLAPQPLYDHPALFPLPTPPFAPGTAPGGGDLSSDADAPTAPPASSASASPWLFLLPRRLQQQQQPASSRSCPLLEAEQRAASLRRAHVALAAQALVLAAELLPTLLFALLLSERRAGEAWRAPLCLPWLAVHGAAALAHGHVKLALLREGGCVAVAWLVAFWRFSFAPVWGGLGATAVLPKPAPPVGGPAAAAGVGGGAAPSVAAAALATSCIVSVAVAAASFVLYWAARALHRVVQLGECGGIEGVWASVPAPAGRRRRGGGGGGSDGA